MPLFDDPIDALYRFPVVTEAARTTKNPAYKSGNASMVRRVPPTPRDPRDGGPTPTSGYTRACR